MLLKFKDTRVEYKKIIAPFDFKNKYKNLPMTKLTEIPVYELIKEFTQSALYFKTLEKNYHIDINSHDSDFNIEFLDKELLNKANEIMEEIISLNKRKKNLSAKFNHMNDNQKSIEEANEIFNKFQECSNKYYELIPRKRFNNTVKTFLFNFLFNFNFSFNFFI
jgi:hypothetical protein